ncbi:inner-membrane translocator [Thermodesulfatator indicus DSM 15286]|uniref:Inner-membrane translocator n=1 Tax=Thermodesulfatator indicus (strain DSM 15286 / JCM 11887 / CIR29812) TaxID=667014 RepID=F8AC77_THEID|nr:branched-chain amino acid ABC transporter permease [Thermodesulfatator indicus]AEH45712.1 inner-membrane translocator [Thermodesulfatator indicus DSM 15286]
MVIEGAIIYANLLVLLALGLTLTYITTNVPNFAQGSFAIVGSYAALTFYRIWHISPYYSLPALFIIGGVVGFLTFLVLNPLVRRGSSIEVLMIATLAIDLILLGIIGAYSEILSNIIGSTQAKFVFSYLDFYLWGIRGIFWVSFGVVFFLVGSLYLLLYKTKFGIALRASMENPALAQIMGINVEKTRLFSWILSGALAGVAGGLIPFMQEIVPGTGAIMIISIFAASIVGGLRHINGALLGGYIIGISESLITYIMAILLGTGFLVYGKLVSMLIMVLTLLIVPQGLTSIKWKKIKKYLGA